MPSEPRDHDADDSEADIERARRASVGQLLFQTARLLNARALAAVRARTGQPIREAHTRLFPHLDHGGTRLTELARRLQVSKQAAGQLVDELVAMGALERVADPRDGRARRIRFVRGPGRGILAGLAVLAELEDDLAVRIGRARMQALHEGLLALRDALEEPGADPGG